MPPMPRRGIAVKSGISARGDGSSRVDVGIAPGDMPRMHRRRAVDALARAPSAGDDRVGRRPLDRLRQPFPGARAPAAAATSFARSWRMMREIGTPVGQSASHEAHPSHAASASAASGRSAALRE